MGESRADSTDYSTNGLNGIGQPQVVPTEDIHVRNYDIRQTHRLWIRLEDADGTEVFERNYTFQPGQATSKWGIADPGIYEVTVELEGRRRAWTQCRIDSTSEHTLLVEVGNGVVTVTEGLW